MRTLCDRRAGIGGDGVLRVIRSSAYDEAARHLDGAEAEWFMDYRNADGSVSEMCGNGIRVFARYLVDGGLVDPGEPIPIGTRDGVKRLSVDGEDITADMGVPRLLGETAVSVGDATWTARHVDVGNPHAVAFVNDLAEAGSLLEEPSHDAELYGEGVNVEFVVRRGPAHVAMRVHERGSGETMSCGTGACAVMVAVAAADEAEPGTDYRVDLPGGTLRIRWTHEGRVSMTGPAVIVARGTTDL